MHGVLNARSWAWHLRLSIGELRLSDGVQMYLISYVAVSHLI